MTTCSATLFPGIAIASGFPLALIARDFNTRLALRRRWNATSAPLERPASARERTEVVGRKIEALAVARMAKRSRRDLMVGFRMLIVLRGRKWEQELGFLRISTHQLRTSDVSQLLISRRWLQMAYLNPPLTIIDNQPNSIVSVPPAATWFDEDRQHFVALTGLPSKGTRIARIKKIFTL